MDFGQQVPESDQSLCQLSITPLPHVGDILLLCGRRVPGDLKCGHFEGWNVTTASNLQIPKAWRGRVTQAMPQLGQLLSQAASEGYIFEGGLLSRKIRGYMATVWPTGLCPQPIQQSF